MSKNVSRQKRPHQINGKTIMLTDKQYEHIRAIVDSKDSEEVLDRTQNIYETDRQTARSILNENLNKPHIKSALSTYLKETENVLSNTMNDYKDSDDIQERKLAVDVAKYVHDKVTGKATQKTSTQSINLNIEAILE